MLVLFPGKQKKKKQQSPRKRVSEVQCERRNPSRKARPPEHFGLEQDPVVAVKPRKSIFDLKKLMEVKTSKKNPNISCMILFYSHFPNAVFPIQG